MINGNIYNLLSRMHNILTHHGRTCKEFILTRTFYLLDDIFYLSPVTDNTPNDTPVAIDVSPAGDVPPSASGPFSIEPPSREPANDNSKLASVQSSIEAGNFPVTDVPPADMHSSTDVSLVNNSSNNTTDSGPPSNSGISNDQFAEILKTQNESAPIRAEDATPSAVVLPSITKKKSPTLVHKLAPTSHLSSSSLLTMSQTKFSRLLPSDYQNAVPRLLQNL